MSELQPKLAYNVLFANRSLSSAFTVTDMIDLYANCVSRLLKSKKVGKYQELIQSSTTPDQGDYMGK